MGLAESGTAWPGWSNEHTLVLPLPASKWRPPTVAATVDGVRFTPKDELHVTLVGGALGSELQTGGRNGFLLNASRTAFEQLDWSFARTGMWVVLQKNRSTADTPATVHSIIERIDLPAMQAFYAAMSRLLGRQLAVPPPHVTLFTAGHDKGIGLASPAQLRSHGLREVFAVELGAAAPDTPPVRRG